jgi:hypothetical protein
MDFSLSFNRLICKNPAGHYYPYPPLGKGGKFLSSFKLGWQIKTAPGKQVLNFSYYYNRTIFRSIKGAANFAPSEHQAKNLPGAGATAAGKGRRQGGISGSNEVDRSGSWNYIMAVTASPGFKSGGRAREQLSKGPLALSPLPSLILKLWPLQSKGHLIMESGNG